MDSKNQQSNGAVNLERAAAEIAALLRGDGDGPVAALLLGNLMTPANEELERRRGERIRALAEAGGDLDGDTELARLDLELRRVGHPSWNEVEVRFAGDADDEMVNREYVLHLQRRLWLASSSIAPTWPIGHGWRVVCGPTPHAYGEVVLPARVVISANDYGRADVTRGAWAALCNLAGEVEACGLDSTAVLGVDADTCARFASRLNDAGRETD